MTAPDDNAAARPISPAAGRQTYLILADLLLMRDRVEEAITMLRVHAAEGDAYASWKLAKLLAERGLADEAIAFLQARAEKGDEYASWQLADLLAKRGRVDQAIAILRAGANADRGYATRLLAALRRVIRGPATAAGGAVTLDQIFGAAEPSSGKATESVAPLRSAAEPVSSARRPIILYQTEDTTVTTTFFESGGDRFPLAELDNVDRVEHGGWLGTRRLEIWATFRGHRIRLFHSFDATQFGQVARALARAREYAGLMEAAATALVDRNRTPR